MRYSAFFGELPVNAFKPRAGGGMTFEGGGNPISAVTDAVSSAVSGVGDVVGSAVNTVGNVVGDVVQTVKDHPLEAAALAAGGYYFAPEIGAWISSDGTALAGTEAGVAAGEVPTTVDALASGAAAGEGSTTAQALYGNAGYGAGMTGGETAAYDTALNSIAPTAAGAAAAGAAGGAAGTSLSGMLPYMAAGQVATGLLGANAATNAAQLQADAAAKAQAQQQANFNLINQQQTPGRAAGAQSLNTLGSMGTGQYTTYDQAGNPTGTGTGSGYLQHQFDANDLANGLAPNYNFQLQQGQMANQRAANAGGGALGGNALQGLNKYTQDYAGNAYQQAFNNYQTQRTGIYNTLAGIAGLGQNANAATNAAATNATNANTQLGVGSAAAQAAGLTGSTNALSNTASNIAGNYTLASLLNQKGAVTA